MTARSALAKKIVIIGAGYCGAAVASLLLRSETEHSLDIVLLNRSGLMARGMAYGTRSNEHLLNVPVGRMDALPTDEGGFLRYAQQLDPTVTGASFVSRQWFGDYLELTLQNATRHAKNGNSLRAMVGDAADIEIRADGLSATVHLQQGESIEADRVILTLGNFAPADPAIALDQRGFYYSPRYVRDPWRPDALRVVKPDQPVLLIGSGLTMLDVMLDLRAHGLRAPIQVLSRRGLPPVAHREREIAPVYDQTLPQRLLAQPTARHWLHQLRIEIAAAALDGKDWRDVIGSLRAATPALWRALTLKQRQRFLRHLRPYWDVHRHRCAPMLGARLQAERDAGSLGLIAGRVLAYKESHDGVEVLLRRRDQRETETLVVAAVINCTGPESNTLTTPEPLISALRKRGSIKPDSLGLGLEVAANYALLDRNSGAAKTLFYAGPFLRADHWEATAIPELRSHAANLTSAVLQSFCKTTVP